MILKTITFLAAFIVFISNSTLANDIYIAPYEGQYSLSLAKVHSKGQDVIDAHGTLTYKLRTDCLGWLSETSIFLDLILNDGSSKTIISNLSSFESFDGWGYSFAWENYTDDEPIIYTGNVSFSNDGDKATVNFSEPKNKSPLSIPGTTLFPVALYKNLIRGANENITYFNAPYYDGTSPANFFDSSIFITSISDNVYPDIMGDIFLLEKQQTIKASIGFFSENIPDIPTFESQFEILNNGILIKMIQTIGPIDVNVTLEDIKFIPPVVCDMNNKNQKPFIPQNN